MLRPLIAHLLHWIWKGEGTISGILASLFSFQAWREAPNLPRQQQISWHEAELDFVFRVEPCYRDWSLVLSFEVTRRVLASFFS